MERSVARAYSDLILWMEEEFGVPRWDGLSLCTMVGEISVGYHYAPSPPDYLMYSADGKVQWGVPLLPRS